MYRLSEHDSLRGIVKKPFFAALLLLLFVSSFSAHAQEKFTISGHITDAETGEAMLGASFQIVELKAGGMANDYGFYSITIPAGSYTVRYSFIEYEQVEIKLTVDKNITRNVALKPKPTVLEEVVATAAPENEQVTSTDMGVADIKPGEVSAVPILFGEQDIIKTIQLLPGIGETREGASGFFVRGGDPDQNLVLLDEAPVYNPSHFLGFFSVFNSDAIKNVRMIKGAAPADYGGRLSSVMDVRMNEGNNQAYRLNGGLGLVFSRLTFEGPIKKDTGSFIFSARRTYADVFLNFAKNKSLKDSKLYFYDFNLKANYKIGDRDRLYVSAYSGRDMLGYASQFEFDWGNTTTTLRWNHLFSDRLFLNSSLIFSSFDYMISINDDGNNVDITSGIGDVHLKEDFEYFISPHHSLRFGVDTIRHRFVPGKIEASEGGTINSYKVSDKYAFESAAYVSHEYSPTDRLKFDYGFRASLFNAVGPGETFTYDESGDVLTEKDYGDNELIESYGALEPRVLSTFIIDRNSSVKASFARNRQYIHMLSNTTSGTPLDLWYPSTNIVGPGTSDQTSVGYFRNFRENAYETSFETYYKDLRGQVDYKNGANILLNKHVESELVFGRGWAYGAEFYVKKNTGKTTGWLSYTLSRTRRHFGDINEGRAYPSKYDRTHDFSVTGIYRKSNRWTFSASWVFHSGIAVTFPSGKYEIDGMTVNYYTERNGYRLPDYHRLDLGATWTHKKTNRYESNLNFSLYNAYGRRNAYAIYFRENEDNPDYTEAVRVSLFTFFPSITYNFSY